VSVVDALARAFEGRGELLRQLRSQASGEGVAAEGVGRTAQTVWTCDSGNKRGAPVRFRYTEGGKGSSQTRLEGGATYSGRCTAATLLELSDDLPGTTTTVGNGP
jgi:hypothetical protein